MLFETGSCPNRAFHLIDENPGWLSATRKLPETAFEDGEMLKGACFCRSFNCRKNVVLIVINRRKMRTKGEQSLQLAFIQRNNVVQQVSSTAFHPPLRDAILPGTSE